MRHRLGDPKISSKNSFKLSRQQLDKERSFNNRPQQQSVLAQQQQPALGYQAAESQQRCPIEAWLPALQCRKALSAKAETQP